MIANETGILLENGATRVRLLVPLCLISFEFFPLPV